MSTLILQTASRLIVPLSLLFALFVYFKGHQEPGGGFVAGLVTGVALIVHRMSFGAESLKKLVPVRERTLIAVGLLLALVTGVVPLLLGVPFLHSTYGYLQLPGGNEFEWASVMAFDLGVLLVVAGTVIGMINALSEETEG